MNRTRQFAVNAGMGYALIGANIAFTMLSIPLALRYLGKEEFGLWALAQQVAGYLMLIDFGMSTAVSRLLANHKDRLNDGSYGSLLLTGAIVFVLQGLALLGLGILFALFAPALFQVPSALAEEFRNVLIILAAVSGATLALRSITAPLWAFQRLDVSYGVGIISLLGTLASLWIGFHLGWGVYSFAVAGILPMIGCSILGFEACRRAGFYPVRGCWGRPRWSVLFEMLAFGKDVTLMSLGSQLVSASQIMILGRIAGLEAAATFAIGTKFYALGSQLTGRLVESSAPALTEMFVRQDHDRLRKRFTDIFSTSMCLATAGAVALVSANALIVTVWTSRVVAWNPSWDLFLGLLLLATTGSRCLIGLFGITGNLRPVRNIYLVEAAVFIVSGVPAAAFFGIPGLLAASMAAHLLVSAGYSAKIARQILGPLRVLHRSVILAAALFAAAAAIAISLLGNGAVDRPTAAGAIIVGFSALAFATMLSREAKQKMLAKWHYWTNAAPP